MTRVLLSLLFLLISSNAWALTITGARIGAHTDKTRLVFEMDEPQDFRAFVLENPYRLIIDLPQFQWKASGLDGAAAANITSIRHGALKPGISRVVLDLKKPIAIQNAFFVPPQSGKPDRLVIDFNLVPSSVFDQTKTSVFGDLNVEAQTPTAATSTPFAIASADGAIPLPPEKPDYSAPSPSSGAYKPLIIIDPGHGGVDPGAIGKNKINEKDVVLKLGRELRDQLLATGRYRVMMTRDSDIFIRLRDRVKFARDNGGDLFVSIHADSIDKPDVQGASVYTLSEKASDEQTAKLAARENKADLIAGIDLSHEDEEVASILVDLATRDTMNQSKFFAGNLVKVLQGGGVKTLPSTHRSAGFAVLKAPDIPSILVEAGFMSNNSEANRLNTPAYRKQVAGALQRGIDAYFDQVKKNERI